MLRPQDSATRERKNLNGLWQFALDPDGEGQTDRWYAGPLADGREMAVPASFNDIAADAAVRDYFGYTPFEADIADHVTPGQQVRITALVNNTLHWQSIPPGVIEDTPAGKRQRYWHDFFNYAGIHRNVWLYTTNPAHFTDVTITTDLDGADGVINYSAQAENAEALVTKVILRNAEGKEVTTLGGNSGTLTVPHVHKWAPGDGYLYDLELQLVDGDTVVDSYHQSVGVRTVKVDGIRFLINDEPFYFTGFGKHEDVPVIGKGHNDPYLLHDFELLKWIGDLEQNL